MMTVFFNSMRAAQRHDKRPHCVAAGALAVRHFPVSGAGPAPNRESGDWLHTGCAA